MLPVFGLPVLAVFDKTHHLTSAIQLLILSNQYKWCWFTVPQHCLAQTTLISCLKKEGGRDMPVQNSVIYSFCVNSTSSIHDRQTWLHIIPVTLFSSPLRYR